MCISALPSADCTCVGCGLPLDRCQVIFQTNDRRSPRYFPIPVRPCPITSQGSSGRNSTACDDVLVFACDEELFGGAGQPCFKCISGQEISEISGTGGNAKPFNPTLPVLPRSQNVELDGGRSVIDSCIHGVQSRDRDARFVYVNAHDSDQSLLTSEFRYRYRSSAGGSGGAVQHNDL